MDSQNYDSEKVAKKEGGYIISLEEITTSIAYLGREELTRRIRDFKGRFNLDFTEDYLNKRSVDKLRHILLVALINENRSNNPKKLESSGV